MRLKDLIYKNLIIFIIFSLLIISCQVSLADEEIYPNNVKLTIRMRGEVIGQEEIFEIIEMEDYILVPLVSLSRWVNFEINYIRENELLTIYYGDKDRSVQIDLENKIYYDHPDWSSEPPLIIEGDFYVSTKLIEYLTEAKLNWEPRQQELILDYDYIEKEDTKIEVRPEDFKVQPEITEKDFSIGSIHYKFGFEYEFEEDSPDGSLLFNNLTAVHGRAATWTYSAQQELQYDYETKEYDFEYPLLSARNSENNRLIVLGDNRFRLSNTLGRVDLRGLYLQYPVQQISERRAYTSVEGEAPEGSTVKLYVNDRKIEEQYIYQGEDSYYFENVPLTINRTNIFRISITDLEGKETEVVKKVAGSLNIFEEGTNEGIFATGRYNKDNDSETFFNVGGLQIKYAPTANTSLLWELGAERISNDSPENGFEGGSLARIAIRSKALPLVFFVDGMAGREVDLIEYGVRASTLYTSEDGYINVSYSYVSPLVEDYVEVEKGQKLQSIYEKELNENWLLGIMAQNTKSISNMDDLDLSIYNLSFDYSDKARNKFGIATEIVNRYEENKWIDLDLIEKSQKSIDILLDGKTYRGETIIGGEVNYNLANINFYDENNDTYLTKRQDYTSLELDLRRNLSENITLIGNFETEFTWLEGGKFERESEVDLKTRLKTGTNTSIIAGISNTDEYDKDEDGNVTIDKLQELELFINYSIPRSLNFTTGITNTYLEEDSYLSSGSSLSYYNPDSDWGLDIDFEYIGPYGTRETAQENISIEVSRYLFSGLESFFRIERDYESKTSEEPIYEASLYFSQALGFADGKSKFQEYEGQRHESYVTGLVYLDENGNKTRDPDERIIEDISIVLDNSRTTTEKDGQFIFENVRKGVHEIGFDTKKLPTGYKPVNQNKVIEVRENENLFLELGLTQLGEIRGSIKAGSYRYGDKGKEVIPLNNIGIKLLELNRIVFTKSDGTFIFKEVPLGEHTLQVMNNSLPEDTMIYDKGSYKIEITPEELINQDIKIIIKQR